MNTEFFPIPGVFFLDKNSDNDFANANLGLSTTIKALLTNKVREFGYDKTYLSNIFQKLLSYFPFEKTRAFSEASLKEGKNMNFPSVLV
jgi:hypothetical protein